MNKNRLCIHSKDICLITGRSERYAQKLIAQIKFLYGKKPHQFVTVEEFADYAGIELSAVLAVVK